MCVCICVCVRVRVQGYKKCFLSVLCDIVITVDTIYHKQVGRTLYLNQNKKSIF